LYAAQELTPEEGEVQVERNAFGYLVNAVLAIVWLSVFIVIICNHQYTNDDWYGLRICLGLASLLLGGFHAYVLHFDDFEKNNKTSDNSLMSRAIKSWPLVLGTILYVFFVCIVYSQHLGDYHRFGFNGEQIFKLNYHNVFRFLAVLNVPLTICAALLAEDSLSIIFRPWNVNVESGITVFECRVVGFLVSSVLALFWLVIAALTAIFLNESGNDDFLFLFLTHIGSLINFGVHLYALCTPKYDSGESSTLLGFIKKNWLIISGCTLTSLAFIPDTISDYESNEVLLIFAFILVISSLCSCLIMIPSNSSQSCMRFLKPWNTANKIEEVSV